MVHRAPKQIGLAERHCSVESTAAPRSLFLTVSETAQELRVSEKTVRRLISKGELPALRVGGQVRVDPVELDQWLRSARRPAASCELERWLAERMSSVGGSFAEHSAMGRSSVDAPAAHVRDPAMPGSRARAQRAGGNDE
jgi:excisionase family DNA binding protein